MIGHALQAHRNRPMVRADARPPPSFSRTNGVISAAELAGAFDDRLEERVDVGRRGGDHPQDIGAAGLVGQGLRQIARLGLHFVKKPHVADRDYRLVGKCLQQADLFFGEGGAFRCRRSRMAPMLSFSRSSGTSENAANAHRAGTFRQLPAAGEIAGLFGEYVGYMYRSPRQRRRGRDDQSRLIGNFSSIDGYRPVMLPGNQVVAFAQQYDCASLASHRSHALSTMAFSTGSNIGRRGGDHVAGYWRCRSGRCSASERSCVLACTSSNRRTFSMAMTAWSAKVCTSSICRWVNGRRPCCRGQSRRRPAVPHQGHTQHRL